ncbi:FAD:protein FMN transferase [Alkalimarinus alittae]|uniref:FAD:protein FMN transferase n=1 Tax=Alkalimarinus alittae TaxID=2961619 RepID=A0ABY6MY24_9ALTE|nr:FAD:protein FMN transferase [Alkalimarinus alittae]UZE94734.1 FAD:protein FMN transferase [Alkalimarinus alittae]
MKIYYWMISEVNEESMSIFSIKPATMTMLKSIVILAGLFISGCDLIADSDSKENKSVTSEHIYEISGPIMGSSYHIKVVLTPDEGVLENLRVGVSDSLIRVDRLMSTYKPDSEISRFNSSPQNEWFAVSPETFEVIELGQLISQRSAGSYDMTVGPLVNSWGFGPTGKPVKIPDEDQLQNVLTRVGFTHLTLDAETRSISKSADIYLDLSSIAKGYAVDVVANFLELQGVNNFLVEVGGEIRANGFKPNKEPWRLAIESPTAEERSIYKVIELTNAGLATSGDYRNYYEENGVRYSHTINPLTGMPVQHTLTSVSVVRPTSAEADAMATMFMVMGPEKGFQFAVDNNIAAYFIFRSDSGFKSQSTLQFEQYLAQ